MQKLVLEEIEVDEKKMRKEVHQDGLHVGIGNSNATRFRGSRPAGPGNQQKPSGNYREPSEISENPRETIGNHHPPSPQRGALEENCRRRSPGMRVP